MMSRYVYAFNIIVDGHVALRLTVAVATPLDRAGCRPDVPIAAHLMSSKMPTSIPT
jgi:hypothetical protein